jgi:hypothetical protein
VLDVVVIKLFKDHLKQFNGEWLLTGNHVLTQAVRNEKSNMTLHCQWILMSWQCSSPEVILEGFKCCIFNAMEALMMTCCGMTVKRTGMLKVCVRKMKALTVKMNTLQTMEME